MKIRISRLTTKLVVALPLALALLTVVRSGLPICGLHDGPW